MVIAQIFLALLWGAAIVAVLVAAIVSTFHVTQWATGATLASGITLRVLATLAAIALLVGAPMLAMGWAQ
jgi:ABC-type amino acid transport system permease subunit